MVARHNCRDCSLRLSYYEGSPELHSWLQAKARNLEPQRRNNHKLYFKKLEKKSFELGPSVFKFQFHHFLLGNFNL